MKMRKLNIENGNTTALKMYPTSEDKPNRRYKKLLEYYKTLLREFKDGLNCKIGYTMFMDLKSLYYILNRYGLSRLN